MSSAQISEGYALVQNVIAYWQSRYHDQYAASIRQDVLDVYGTHVAARVAHSESLRGLVTEKQIIEDLRSDAALTISVLGLIPEDHVLMTKLGGKTGGRRHDGSRMRRSGL